MYDPSIRLNNNVQYVMNTLKTYGYPQQVLDSFKQDIDKILANTKDNNRIDAANQYINQFLENKYLPVHDLRRLNPAPNQQPQKAGNKNKPDKKPRMSDDEIDAFLKEELGGNPSKKTIGWSSGNGYMYEDDHPNNWRTSYGNSGKIKDRDTYTRGSIPGSMGLSYTEPSQVQMTRNDAVPETFSDSDWNAAHGISYVTGKDGLIYRIDPQHPNGYVDPFKNDLSKTGSIGYATGKGMLTSSSDGSYSSQEGMQSPMPASDNWKFREAWKDPMAIIGQFGRGAFTDNEYNQLVNHAVNDLGYNKNVFSGSRFG